MITLRCDYSTVNPLYSLQGDDDKGTPFDVDDDRGTLGEVIAIVELNKEVLYDDGIVTVLDDIL